MADWQNCPAMLFRTASWVEATYTTNRAPQSQCASWSGWNTTYQLTPLVADLKRVRTLEQRDPQCRPMGSEWLSLAACAKTTPDDYMILPSNTRM